MLMDKWTEDDWYHPKWYDQALSALYDGIWLDCVKYGEVESKLMELGYLPQQVHKALNLNLRPLPKRPIPKVGPTILKTPKRVDKKLSKERKEIKEIQSSLANEIAFARQRIQNFLKSSDIYACDFDTPGFVPALIPTDNKDEERIETPATVRFRVERLEKEYDVVLQRLNALTEEVRVKMQIMNAEAAGPKKREPTAVPTELKKVSNEINKYLKTKYLDNWPKVPKKTLVAAAAIEDFDDYDDLALYATDEELDEQIEKDRLEELGAEIDKAKKPGKSQYVLDVLTSKTRSNREMMELTRFVRGIKMIGLRIRATKILNVQYHVRRLQVICVVDEDKLSIEDVRSKIMERRDLVTRVAVVHSTKL